jgi:hypothetical protein
VKGDAVYGELQLLQMQRRGAAEAGVREEGGGGREEGGQNSFDDDHMTVLRLRALEALEVYELDGK